MLAVKYLILILLMAAIAALYFKRHPIEGFMTMKTWCDASTQFCNNQYNNRFYKDSAKHLNCLDYYKNRNIPPCGDLIKMPPL